MLLLQSTLLYDIYYGTPLQWAAWDGRLDVVKYLVEDLNNLSTKHSRTEKHNTSKKHKNEVTPMLSSV